MATSRALTDTNQVSRALIAKMLAEGTSSAPIQHWTQGLARLSNALVGGMNLSALRGQEQAKEASDKAEAAASDAEIARLLALPGGGGVPQPGPQAAAGSPVAAALAPPAMPQQMASLGGQPNVAADVTTLEPHQTRGVIKGNLSDEPVMSMSVDGQPMPQPQPQRVAQALAPQMPPPMQSGVPQIPPEIRARINALVANKGTRAAGIALQNQWLKPNEPPEAVQSVDYMRANPQVFGFSGPQDPGLQEIARKRMGGPGTNVSVNNVANPFLKGIGEEVLNDRKVAINAATKAIPDIHEARKALDAGAITGAGADIRLMAAKVGALFGMDTSTVANTEQLRAMISSAALENIKKLGANPSNVDLKFIKDVVGSNIALDEKTLRRLLDIQEKYARQAIRSYNATAKKMMDADPETFGKIAPAMQFEEPPEYAVPVQTKTINGKSYYKKGNDWFEGAPQ
jgi:hypothetical protein